MIYQIKEDAYGSKDIPVPYTTAHPRCAYYSVGKRVLIKSYTKVVHRVRSSVNVLVIESLSLEWFHGNCLFFFGCSIPFLFFPMKHKWTTKQTSKTKNAQKLRRCELGYCLVSVLKCAGHELRINWPQQKKKLIIILICAEIAERSKIDFLPLTSTAGSRSLIEIFQKILFAQTLFLKHY